MRRPNNTPILIGVSALALGAMVVLNRAQYDNRPRTEAEMQEETQQEMQAAKAKASTAPAGQSSPEGGLLALPAEKEFGNPQSTRTVVLGYSWAPEVQSDPQKASEGLKSLQQMLEQMNTQMNLHTRFRLVNTEVVRSQEPGIWMDGRFVSDLDLLSLQTNASTVAQSLMRELNQPLSAK